MCVYRNCQIYLIQILFYPFSEFKKDWSDHALWWPTRNKWLSRPKHTLDQYGVHADATLHFTPMHKPIRIQLPDLRYIDCKIDFSIDTFSAVVQLCKSLGKYSFYVIDCIDIIRLVGIDQISCIMAQNFIGC